MANSSAMRSLTPTIVPCLPYSLVGSSGRTHKHVVGSRLPFHTTLCFKINLHPLVPYSNLQPASQSILSDTKDVWAKTGMIWALVAAFSIDNATATQLQNKTVGVYMKVNILDALLFTNSHVTSVVNFTLEIPKTLPEKEWNNTSRI